MCFLLSPNSMRRLLCVCLFFFALTAAAFAQQQNDEIAPGVISGTSSFASPYSNGLWGEYFPRVSVQHRTEGAGYNYSFTDFRTWVPLYESYDAHALTFVDAAFLLANDRNVGMNAVVGQRFYSDDFGRTFGGYVGYDNRDTGLQTVGQVVTGFESLGRIDFRANGYFPTDTSPVSTGMTFSDPTYVGYNIQLTQLSQYQVAMKGFDAEVGGALPKLGDYVRAYFGVYNFQGQGSPQAWGWKTRFESHVTDRMRLYLTVSDDQVFDTNVVFGAAFFFPGSSARRVPRYDSFVNKMDEPIIRNEAVVVNNHSATSTVNATNIVSGVAQRVIHVDPNAVVMGDGTVENPYNALQLAQAGSQPNDIIFVHPRADNTATNLTQDFVLQDNQRLLASTTQHMFTATQGTFDLPGYEAGNRPTLDSSGDAITLANNNEVSGFRFSDTGGDSIVGNGITGFNINNNQFDGFGSFGEAAIYIQNAGGTGIIRDNVVSNIASLGDTGFFVELGDTSNLLITGNTLTRQLSAGGNNGIDVRVLSGVDATVDITNNTLTNFLAAAGTGIRLESFGNLTSNISHNEIYQGLTVSMADYGIRVRLMDGTAALTIDDNTIGTIATAQALNYGIRVEDATSGGSYVRITNNTLDDFLTGSVFLTGIGYQTTTLGTHDLVLSGNYVNHSGVDIVDEGIVATNNGGGLLNINAFDNVVTADTISQNYIFAANGAGNVNLRMVNNTAADRVRIATSLSGDLRFEVFGGQMVPSPLTAADVTGQNTITGAVQIVNGGFGSTTAVAPNSLPIPD